MTGKKRFKTVSIPGAGFFPVRVNKKGTVFGKKEGKKYLV